MDIESVYNTIKEFSEFANKEVGQNYLINKDIASSIVNLLDIKKDDNVFEVGSGFGALSIYLLNKEYKTLTFNEIDARAVEFLDGLISHTPRAYVINKSALKIDVSIYNKIIGNLPYYITNDLLEYYFTKCDADKYVFMVQKEVIDRLVAKENTDNYGPLAILINYVGMFKKELNVNKINFLPSPHIDSLVFSLTKKNKNEIDKYEYLQFLKKMFLHRRKTIYNNLSLYLMNKEKAKNVLDSLNVSILTRPEQISPSLYLTIFKKIKK